MYNLTLCVDCLWVVWLSFLLVAGAHSGCIGTTTVFLINIFIRQLLL